MLREGWGPPRTRESAIEVMSPVPGISAEYPVFLRPGWDVTSFPHSFILDSSILGQQTKPVRTKLTVVHRVLHVTFTKLVLLCVLASLSIKIEKGAMTKSSLRRNPYDGSVFGKIMLL